MKCNNIKISKEYYLISCDIYIYVYTYMRIPRWLSGKESTCQCRYQKCGFNTWLGRSPGEGNGKQLQRSCLDNPMDRAVSGGLQFIGWQRVGCDSTHTRTHSYIYIYTHTYIPLKLLSSHPEKFSSCIFMIHPFSILNPG